MFPSLTAGLASSHGASWCHIFPRQVTHANNHPYKVEEHVNTPSPIPSPPSYVTPWFSSDDHLPMWTLSVVDKDQHGHSNQSLAALHCVF